MPTFEQTDQQITIDSPLGSNALLVSEMSGREAVSELFAFDLDLRSPKAAIDANDLIGQGVTLTLHRSDGSGDVRYFHGIVTEFENRGLGDRDLTLYAATLRPWTWLLTQTVDCRIFQQQDAVAIVKKILTENGFGPFDFRTKATPPTRDYCVQYNETDFAFISRLMEEEGIFYFFKHENGKHTMVMADDLSALDDGAEATVNFKSKITEQREKDRISRWSHRYELRPGKWAHTDYNFETPTTDLLKKSNDGALPMMNKLEVFEYPGNYGDNGVGTSRAKIRAEQNTARLDTVSGTSSVEAFAAGTTFSVGEHHNAAEAGRKYALLEVEHNVDQSGSYNDAHEGHADTAVYKNTFLAVPAETKYRPARVTPRPRLGGPQTALVVGPGGEEIWTDKYGRIKVQFHWDRYGQNDDHSSCWVRVAYTSAGGTFGTVAIPRIKQEVVVEFVNGDPDCPLVTGVVYNASNMPPVSNAGRKSAAPSDMPGAKMMTTIRSQSLGGSGGHNEITMNDTGGAEGLFIKAQKDEVHTVANDREDTVGNNETRKVGVNRTRTVGVNEDITIGVNRTTTIGANDTQNIAANRSITVGGSKNETIALAAAENIGLAKALSIGAAYQISVGAAMNESVGGAKTEQVGGLRDESVGGDKSTSVGGTLSESAKEITLSADQKITLRCGASMIELTPATITIQGPLVKLNC